MRVIRDQTDKQGRQDKTAAAKINRKMLTNGRSQIYIIPSLIYVFNNYLD